MGVNYQQLQPCVVIPVPAVTGLSVASGPTSGGTSTVITGTGFTSVSSVLFGTTPASSFSVTSTTSIDVTSPAHAAGTVDVTVTNTSGTSPTSSASKFTYGSSTPSVVNFGSGFSDFPATTQTFTWNTSTTAGNSLVVCITCNNSTVITAPSGYVLKSTRTLSGTSAQCYVYFASSASSRTNETWIVVGGGGSTIATGAEIANTSGTYDVVSSGATNNSASATASTSGATSSASEVVIAFLVTATITPASVTGYTTLFEFQRIEMNLSSLVAYSVLSSSGVQTVNGVLSASGPWDEELACVY
jgi:large repetitive protein